MPDFAEVGCIAGARRETPKGSCRVMAYSPATGEALWLTRGGYFTAEHPSWAVVARFDSVFFAVDLAERAPLPAGAVLAYAFFTERD